MFSRQLSVQTMQSARTIKKNGTDRFFIRPVPFFNRSSIPTETVIVKQNSYHLSPRIPPYCHSTTYCPINFTGSTRFHNSGTQTSCTELQYSNNISPCSSSL